MYQHVLSPNSTEMTMTQITMIQFHITGNDNEIMIATLQQQLRDAIDYKMQFGFRDLKCGGWGRERCLGINEYAVLFFLLLYVKFLGFPSNFSSTAL